MQHLSYKLLGGILSAIILASGLSLDAQAATASSALPSGGAMLTLGSGVDLETATAGAQKNIEIESIVESVTQEEVVQALEQAQQISDEELFRNLVIAQVRNYVNVRDFPSETEGRIIGKLYNNSAGTFIEEENGWYLIKSGSVTGYVKGEFCVTGDEAIELAQNVGTHLATVNTTTLHVRSDANIDAPILGLVPFGDDLVVSELKDGWAYVDTEEGMGYISLEYADLSWEFVHAESKAEEEARLAKEAEERRKAQASASAVVAANYTKVQTIYSDYSVVGGSQEQKAVAEYALQFVGNPYVYGGTSLTKGADCSGFVMSVYAAFGVSLPHSSKADRSQGSAIGSLDEAQPGDLICYSGHVGMYIGDGKIVHAANKRKGIIVSNANYKRILAIRRIL